MSRCTEDLTMALTGDAAPCGWLAREFPQLVPHYRSLFGRGSYLPQSYQREVTARVRMAARRHGLHRSEPGEARQVAPAPTPAPAVEQLTLL